MTIKLSFKKRCSVGVGASRKHTGAPSIPALWATISAFLITEVKVEPKTTVVSPAASLCQHDVIGQELSLQYELWWAWLAWQR
jgi:hypothetical protein